MSPSVDGKAMIRTPKQAFLAAFKRRVETALFGSTPRSRYVVTRESSEGLQFRAADWATAHNVGLNEVELEVPGEGNVHYVIRYPRWSSYVLALGAVIGAMLIAFSSCSTFVLTSRRTPGLRFRAFR